MAVTTATWRQDKEWELIFSCTALWLLPSCKNVEVAAVRPGVWAGISVCRWRHTKSFIISSCWDQESQICHWSNSNTPPPALPQLITSSEAQKAPSYSWSAGGKPETCVVMCIPLVAFFPSKFWINILRDTRTASLVRCALLKDAFLRR